MAILGADLRRVSAGGEIGGVLLPFRRPTPDRSMSVAVSSRTSTAVDMLVGEIAARQPLPPIAAQVLQIAEDSRFSAHALAQAISSDPASTSLILRLANSPYYALPCRISTVRDAVVLLGFHQVSGLVVAAAVLRAFTNSEGLSAAQLWQFWRHSVAVGLMSETLGRADRMHCDVAFTAGFLHNIGRIALAQTRPEEFAEIRAQAGTAGVSVQAAERQLLGATDTEIGAALLARWGFCPDLVTAVRQHVEMSEAFDDASLASLIARARGAVARSGIADGIERVPCQAALPYPDRDETSTGLVLVIRRDPADDATMLAPMMSRVAAFLDQAGMT